MGRDDAVGRGQKGIARRDGFFGYYVHSGGAETAAFQRGFYRRFVHETAPGGVDEDGARLHFREGAGVYQLRCRRGERAVEGDKIRLGEQGVQIDILRQRFPFGTAGAAVGKNIHAKGAGNVRHGLTDAPEADNAQRLPGQLHLRGVPEAEGAAAFPPTRMYQHVVVSDPVTQLQHQRERKLRHGGGTVGGDVGHGNAPAGAGGTVHGIVAGRLNADQTDAGTGIQQPLGDGELVHQHDLTVSDAGNGFVLGVRAVVNGQFAELAKRLVAQIAGI